MFTHSELTPSCRLSSRLRNGLLCAGLALATAASVYAGPASANYQDLFNKHDMPLLDPATNTYGPNGIEIDFQGDVCSNIPAQYVDRVGTDPFYALAVYEQTIGGPVVTPSFSCSFDGTITHALWSGGTMPVPLPATGWPVPLHADIDGNLYVHSSLDEGTPSLTGIQPLYRKWIWTQTNPAQSLIVPDLAAMDAAEGVQKKPKYAVLFIQTGGTGQPDADTPTGSWYLLSYQGSPKFTLSNNGLDPISLPVGQSGIVTGVAGPSEEQCEKTPDCYQTILETLNDQGYPEPGTEGSPFTPIKLPSQLAPGQTYTFKAPK
ncbi:MAG TPA: hypothetical protein VHX61_00245 [Rhizomicrobium sp.]|jgi:hypothetical protein|nr:hypothetical protein [Rhizomicrobium sp.]